MTTQDTLSGSPLRRALSHVAQARRRRHGRRLPRRRPGARTQGRRQDAPRALRERRAVRRALPPRGDARRRALAPEHRLDLRPGRGRRLLLHRHGVRRGPHAQGADPLARALPGAGGHRLHAPDPRRAALRPPQRRRPPRHQAAQRHRRLRGRRQGDRLRDRPRGREPDDRGGRDHRHRALSLAGAGARRAGRPDLRPLLRGHRPLRAAHGRGSVHGRQPGRDRDEAPFGDAAGAVRAPA